MKPIQLDLFSQPTLATVVRDVKAAMNQTIKESAYSRDQVLDRMNILAARYGVQLNKKARELSKDLFEKWLNVNESTQRGIPPCLPPCWPRQHLSYTIVIIVGNDAFPGCCYIMRPQSLHPKFTYN